MNRELHSITVDRERCAGSGVCMVFAPKTFDMDDDTKAFVLDATGDPLEQLHAAAAGCPMQAIAITPVSPAGSS